LFQLIESSFYIDYLEMEDTINCWN